MEDSLPKKVMVKGLGVTKYVLFIIFGGYATYLVYTEDSLPKKVMVKGLGVTKYVLFIILGGYATYPVYSNVPKVFVITST